MLRDPHLEPRQLLDHGELGVVTIDPAGSDTGGVLRCDGARHRKG